MKAHLLIIDPQNDFCDPARGALYVPGAEKDMLALAEFVARQGEKIDAIHVTLDSHQSIHVAHPIFWQDQQGRHPQPFTVITRQAVEAGEWTPSNPEWQERGLGYVRALEKHRRYELMIWPPHCRIGSWGHSIFPCVSDALLAWEEKFLKRVDFIFKGGNSFTEHYSAVVADVPDEQDPSTRLNTRLIDQIKDAERVWVAGEALSHCVANTVTDIAANLDAAGLRRFVLLRNTTSNVAGCESLGEAFLKNMAQRGLQVKSSGEVKD